MSTLANRDVRKVIRRQTLNRAKRMHEYYIMLLIPVVLLVVFKYLPMYGIIIAFKDFSIGRGIHDSPWNNFEHFKRLFQDPFFYRITRNTVIISVYRIVFGFPAPIILALLLNEIRSVAYKKTVQTLSYLPHFVSWVVLAGIFVEILSAQRGPIAYLFTLVGLEPVSWLTYKPTFRGVLVVTGIWQSVGWGSIVYLASLSSIDPSLYETASIDGANRFQQAVRITVPSLMPVMTIPLPAQRQPDPERRIRADLQPLQPVGVRGGRRHRHLHLPIGFRGAPGGRTTRAWGCSRTWWGCSS